MDPITDKEDVKYYLGKIYFMEGDYKKAIKTYEEGLSINPESVILLYEIGSVYLRFKDRKKALKYWKRLLNIAPYSFLADEARWRLIR